MEHGEGRLILLQVKEGFPVEAAVELAMKEEYGLRHGSGMACWGGSGQESFAHEWGPLWGGGFVSFGEDGPSQSPSRQKPQSPGL